MDVLLLNTSVYELPSSQRVGAIVYGGTSDLRLWPGPGPDRGLLAAYGPGLPSALDAERNEVGCGEIPIGGFLRIHPGKLHCDFLVWVAMRRPEPGTERSPAPDSGMIGEAVQAALLFVAKRNVVRIAFPALGAGVGELGADERLALVVRAANAYADRCKAAGTSPGVEEVLVCDTSSGAIAAVRRRTAGLTREVEDAAGAAASEPSPPRRPARNKPPAGTVAKRTSRRAPPRLDPDAVARARTTAGVYDRGRVYATGDWFLHSKFGAGRVETTTAEGAIVVLFEDGAQRKMVHSRH